MHHAPAAPAYGFPYNHSAYAGPYSIIGAGGEPGMFDKFKNWLGEPSPIGDIKNGYVAGGALALGLGAYLYLHNSKSSARDRRRGRRR